MSGITSGGRVLRDRLAAHATLAEAGGDTAPPLPDYVVHVLARLRLLEGVPFQYLAAHPGLLPPESARFFTLDPAWLDQLCLGALAVGAGGTREQAQSQLGLAPVQQALGRQIPLVRDLERGRLVLETALGGVTREADPAGAVTGILIRSPLISGWPSLQVRAYTTDDVAQIPLGVGPAELEQSHPELTVQILRLALLEPSILLVLFAGVPRMVWLEEPHHGVQFGVETAGAGFDVPERTEAGEEPGDRIAVTRRARGGDLGVLDITAFAGAVGQARGLQHSADAAQVALALMRAPARQRFGASTPTPPGR